MSVVMYSTDSASHNCNVLTVGGRQLHLSLTKSYQLMLLHARHNSHVYFNQAIIIFRPSVSTKKLQPKAQLQQLINTAAKEKYQDTTSFSNVGQKYW